MGVGHGHGVPVTDAVSASGRHLRPLTFALVIGACFMVLELIVGLATSSLALLSDAAHMLTDVVGIGMALTAVLIARRTNHCPSRTFGMYRAEVLAALANAVMLFGVAAYVIYEAIERLTDPPEVPGLPVLLAAAGGLLANAASFAILRKGAGESINVRGAYLEVLADLIGSFAVLVSGAVTLLFGWRYADPVFGVVIGLFVLPRTWTLARRALRILFQHAPERVNVDQMTADLSGLPGVVEVHDLHVWTLTSGMEVASAHLTTRENTDLAVVLRAAQTLLAESYHIRHATLQVEPGAAAKHCRDVTW